MAFHFDVLKSGSSLYMRYVQRYMDDVPNVVKQKHTYLPLSIHPSTVCVCIDDDRNVALIQIHSESPAEFDAPAAYALFINDSFLVFNAEVIEDDESLVDKSALLKFYGLTFNVESFSDVPNSLQGDDEILKKLITEALICLADKRYVPKVLNPETVDIKVFFNKPHFVVNYENSAR